MARLFVDLDGVLADFALAYGECSGKDSDCADAALDWDALKKVPNLYRDLKLLPDASILIDTLKSFKFTVLTASPHSIPEAGADKRLWVAKHLGPEIPVITETSSKEKYLHGKPGDILIDDRFVCGIPWQKMGGIWIRHTSAIVTVRELMKVAHMLEESS